MNLNKWIKENRSGIHHTKELTCKDGLKLSIQASSCHYSTPQDGIGPYTEIELMIMAEKLLDDSEIAFKFDESDRQDGTNIFPYLPIEKVLRLILKHGGVEGVDWYDTDMQQYKDFQPTGFDPKGYMLDDQQDWYVVPVSRTRDTGPFEESNFAVALEILGGERERIVEVYRFGHWGPGWFEIIIVNPRAGKTMRKALSIEQRLADYSILDEVDWSNREWEEMMETWENMSISERMGICAKTGNSIFAARHDEIPKNVYYEHLCGC